ncbi:MAG: sodium:solute symporter family protein [Clostridia bacterium]|nr:MAG: sodium:solute symporter family protein [Clostridia bacterium]
MTFTITFLIVFAIVLIAIGAYAARIRIATAEDYFVAGRTIGIIATLFGLMATQMSAFIFMGMGSQAFLMGTGSFTQLIGDFVVMFIFFHVFRRAWQLGKAHGYITQADLLVDRYESPTFMRLFPSVLGIVAIIAGHFAIQFIATGLIFNVISRGALPYWFGVLFTAGIVLAIVLVGGFRATAWTDILLGLWIVVSLLLILVFTLNSLGMGLGAAFQTIAEKFPQMISPPGDSPPGRPPYWTHAMIISWLIILMGFPLYPHMWMRSYAARSDKTLAVTALAWVPLTYLVCFVPIVVGILARLFWAGPQELGFPPDAVIAMLVTRIVPAPWLIPIILAGALAAIISTINGSLIGISAMVTHDIIRSKISPGMPQEKAVWWGRLVVFAATVVAVLIALARLNFIYVLFISGTGIVTLFLVPLVGGLVWPRLNRQGATWGLLVSEIMLLWMTYGPKSLGGGFMNNPAWLGLPPTIWALIVEVVVTVVVTLTTEPPSKKVEEKFFSVAPAGE